MERGFYESLFSTLYIYIYRERIHIPSVLTLSFLESEYAEIQHRKARIRDFRINNCGNIKLKCMSIAHYTRVSFISPFTKHN